MADELNNSLQKQTMLHDLQTILSSSERDYLIRNNGDQVKTDSLKGKKIGLYFSASWCPPCRRFTPSLVDLYNELSIKGDFEIVFISKDRDDESFEGYFSKMPWLAVPFSDSNGRKQLNELFKVKGIPFLVFLDDNGEIVTSDGVKIVMEYGVEAYPFSNDRIKEIKEEEEEARVHQSLKSLLVSKSRDYLVSSDGKKVPVTELEGKTIGLYFSISSYGRSTQFTRKLVNVEEQIKAKNADFEVVMIPLDHDEELFKKELETIPWLSLPFKDKSCEKLARYFELSSLPRLVIIGPDGKTLKSDVAEIVEEHGAEAYPFTPERLSELEELDNAKREAQTFESVLVLGDLNFLIGKDGVKVPISEFVVGKKNVLLYFSAHWCPPCRAFLPKLTEVYNQIKEKEGEESFELIFISSDRDQASFDSYYATMPWLALPFGDDRKEKLSRTFKVRGIPKLVALGPTGQTVSEEVRDLVMRHGAKGYPFTKERVEELEKEEDELTKEWAKKMKIDSLHKHELVLIKRRNYICDGCNEGGETWSYYCKECDYDLHPKCAFQGAAKEEKGSSKEGWVCDGEVCRKKA
ncbi:probable nucleoredoxin 1 [Impatiens glandulifera]|uniref:probable nucleoredoxin 1 n=1 Tax=Impatiens glandulifera TaxID=253017 RepID=UPI001FB07102|nr:probable nucleoredoxin 1 [Impatiens glandulifera]